MMEVRFVKRADIAGGIITILFGIFAVTQAVQLDYWSRFGPGPGFIPLWSSIIIVAGGLLLLGHALRRPKAAKRPKDPEKVKRLTAVAAVAFLSIVAALLMDYLGFTVAMFLFMVVMVGGVGRHKWYVTITTAAIVAATFYFGFSKWLQVPLPKGIVGF